MSPFHSFKLVEQLVLNFSKLNKRKKKKIFVVAINPRLDYGPCKFLIFDPLKVKISNYNPYVLSDNII